MLHFKLKLFIFATKVQENILSVCLDISTGVLHWKKYFQPQFNC